MATPHAIIHHGRQGVACARSMTPFTAGNAGYPDDDFTVDLSKWMDVVNLQRNAGGNYVEVVGGQTVGDMEWEDIPNAAAAAKLTVTMDVLLPTMRTPGGYDVGAFALTFNRYNPRLAYLFHDRQGRACILPATALKAVVATGNLAHDRQGQASAIRPGEDSYSFGIGIASYADWDPVLEQNDARIRLHVAGGSTTQFAWSAVFHDITCRGTLVLELTDAEVKGTFTGTAPVLAPITTTVIYASAGRYTEYNVNLTGGGTTVPPGIQFHDIGSVAA